MAEGPSYRTAIGSSGRRPWVGLAVAGALVMTAILKPWGSPAPDEATASPLPTAAARSPIGQPVASGDPSALPISTPAQIAAAHCRNVVEWTVFSVQERVGHTFNVWTLAYPVPAADADPATLVYTPIFAERLTGFGYCAGDDNDGLRPRPADPVTIWRVDPADLSVSQVPATSIEPDLRADFGALLAPSAAPVRPEPSETGWPAGRYLIRVGDAVIGAEVVLLQFRT